jgi:Flp pilus assembly protein TadD
MARSEEADPRTLRRDIERALRRDDAPHEIVPMLERLQRVAHEGSDEHSYADRRLAELLLEANPWRAAMHVRRLVDRKPNDDAAWALMGLAQALLGNHKFACQAYREALAIDPNNPWYSHNLGHLLDVAIDRPRDALRHLECAHRGVPDEPAIACSLVHALWRSGEIARARKVLRPLLSRRGVDPDVVALATELDRAEQGKRAKRRALGGPASVAPSKKPRAAERR